MMNDFKPVERAKAKVAGLLDDPKHPRFHKRVHWWLKNLSLNQRLIVLVVVVLIVGGGVLALNKLGNKPVKEAQNTVAKKEAEPPKPTTVASRLTGIQVPTELNDLPVTGVMIENSPDARPQAGLIQADMVVEAIAEGGITRFLALFQESKPDYLGPVRSVRPYYLDFLVPLDGAIVHAGGSGEALAQIKAQNIKDIDHGANGGAFQRVSNRYAPHNLYTSRANLLDIHSKRGYTSSNYKGLARKEKEGPTVPVTAKSIDLNISGPLYNVRYDYDPAINAFRRSEGGRPHVDERSGNQLAPKVVVVLVMNYSQNGIYSVYNTTSGGEATVFQDGVAIPAKWEKIGRTAELVLKNTDGSILPLNPGQTWITLIAGADRIKYAP